MKKLFIVIEVLLVLYGIFSKLIYDNFGFTLIINNNYNLILLIIGLVIFPLILFLSIKNITLKIVLLIITFIFEILIGFFVFINMSWSPQNTDIINFKNYEIIIKYSYIPEWKEYTYELYTPISPGYVRINKDNVIRLHKTKNNSAMDELTNKFKQLQQDKDINKSEVLYELSNKHN